jgi:hypothetical protein
MYWVLVSERSDEYEISIDKVPPIIEAHRLYMDQGCFIPGRVPTIDIPFTQHVEERKTDNIVVPTRMGLFVNEKVKSIFDKLGIRNIQYFKARLIQQNTQIINENYCIANVIGKYACVDHQESELEYFDDGDIQFIDKLVLNLEEGNDHGHIFRLAEFPALLMISQQLKDMIVESNITGFKIYKPEEFSL